MAESFEVRVKADKIHGSRATIAVKPATGVSPESVGERVRDLLARYTIRYDLEIL